MNPQKIYLLAFLVLITASITNADLVLTLNGVDAAKEPLEIKGKDNLLIAVAGETQTDANRYSVITYCDVLKVHSGDYFFTFEGESGVIDLIANKDMVINGISVEDGDKIYELVLFYIPETDTVIAFGINLEALNLQKTDTLGIQDVTHSEAGKQGSAQSSSTETTGTQQNSGSPIYGPSFCPDLNRDHIVNFIDFAIFAENWLQTGSDLDGDFYDSGIVNVIDLANFCFYWLEEEPIVAESQDVNVTEDQAVVINLRAYDCDGSEGFTYSIVNEPLYGFMAIDVNRVIYAPDINYVGEDHFTFVAEKGDYQSNFATISITVLADTDDDGLSDYDEINGTYGYVTDPCDPDSDSDDMPDGWEVEAGLNPTVNDSSGNPDNDGLTNIEEYNNGTHPNIADTDGDGLKDGDEVNGTLGNYGPIWPYDNSYPDYYYTPFVDQPYNVPLNPLNPDNDLDEVMDGDEIKWGLDPNNPDTDSDGVDDSAEVSYNGNSSDFHPWPLWNYLHVENFDDCDMNPNDDDTDGDSMGDKWEYENAEIDIVWTKALDPRYDGDPSNDTDSDGLINSIENSQDLSSKVPEGWDTDGDGLSDGDEYYGSSSPSTIDTDSDGLVDGDSYTVKAEDYPEGISEYYGGSRQYVFGEEDCGTLPNNQDSDSDNMPDGWETWNWDLTYHDYFDPAYNHPYTPGLNFDSDNFTNLQESLHFTSAWLGDTDSDNAKDDYEVNTLQTNPKNNDTDGDGLKDGDESEHGADPLDYDSDDDLLADGWEVQYGFDPTEPDVDYVDSNGNNMYLDSDLDGLDDFEEVIYGTNPKNDDTDNDGVEDGEEVNQVSDPLDENDKTAPPANQICQIRLTVGDYSLSNSERYKLIVGPVTHIATKFGEVQSKVYKFRTGRAYNVKIEHVDSTREEPDCDYTAEIEKVSMPAGAAFGKDDPDGILGEHGDWGDTTEFYAEGKTARIALCRPTHTVSYEGDLHPESESRSYFIRDYYLEIYEGGTLIDFPGIPCDEVIRWEESTPWYVKALTKTGPGTTKEWPERDGEWPATSNIIAAQDRLGIVYFLAGKYSAVQTITVDGVTTEPTYTNYFDIGNDDRVWKK